MLKKIYRHIDDYLEVYFASTALIAFSFLVVLQVFMRYILGSPLVWSEELARFALVWFVWIAGSYAVKYQRHVKFSVLVNLVGKKLPLVRRIVQTIVYLLWLAFIVLMLVLSWEQVQQLQRTGQVSAGSRVPMYVVYFGLTLGMLFMTFRVVQHSVIAVIDIIKNPLEPFPQETIEVD